MVFRHACTVLVSILASAVAPIAQAEFKAYTIEDIGRPYEALEGNCFYSEAAGFSLKGDPIEGALNRARTKVVEYAAKIGADAMVKFDVDFANRTERDEGRVILCGTFVKYK
jgi:hypothetical protein